MDTPVTQTSRERAANRSRMLQIRTTEEQYEALDELARRTGMDRSKLVRSRLPEVFGEEPSPGATESAPNAPERVDVVHLINERTGMPKSLVRRALANGHVTVAGEVCAELELEPHRLIDLRFDGNPISP